MSLTYTFTFYILNHHHTLTSSTFTPKNINMSKIFSTAVLFAGLVAQVSGHTAVESAEFGGVTYEGFRGATIDAPLAKGSPAWKTNQG